NKLPQATSLHWHGVRISNAMDGVAGLTQDAIPTGETFDYDFAVPDAGTFWFHAHNRSVEQVARGLYGALIVEEPIAPDVDRDEVLILDDWLLNPE
ncbi:multicopper oxidase domain-containing protein, partial [Flavihumibacter sediminis]|nr:multicopper oxidase domain-containing protein [Flavihumibacter sediminis]